MIDCRTLSKPLFLLCIFADKFQDMCLKTDDERYIRSMIENPISIILLGNRPCVKARIANYILGYELLPVRIQMAKRCVSFIDILYRYI